MITNLKNMVMKASIKMVFAALFVMAATTLSAQPQRGGNQPSSQERAQNMVKRMEQKLTLSTSEKQEMTTIYTDFFEQMKELRTRQKPQENRVATEKAIQDRDNRVKALLKSDERFAIFQEIEKQNREKVKNVVEERQGDNAPGEDFRQLKEKLALSEDQSKKFDEIFRNHHQQMKELRQAGTPAENAKKMKALKAERDAQVKALLNSDEKYIIYLESLNEKRDEVKTKMIEKRQGKKGKRPVKE